MGENLIYTRVLILRKHIVNRVSFHLLICGPQGGTGGTLKFSVYIGEADFLGVKILNFRIFWGFSEKLVIFRVVSFLWIFLGGHAFSELFFWGHL